jgi:hypothetical protein
VRALAVVSCALALAGCPSIPPAQLDPGGPWVHAESGITFPETHAGFVRVSRSSYGDSNARVGYDDTRRGVALTLYVREPLRSEDGALLSPEMALAAEQYAIVERRSEVSPIEVPVAPERCGSATLRSAAAFRYDEIFAGRRQPVESLLLLYDATPWSVKFRVTYPIGRTAEARAAVQAFIDEFPLQPRGTP